MTRHLEACIEKKSEIDGKAVRMFHLVIEGTYLPMYWLHVDIPGAMTLRHLDAFLRGIWLECCGHLSAFTIDGQRYSVQPTGSAYAGMREKNMQQKIYRVLAQGVAFKHEYDYGSTTELSLRVADIRERRVKSPDILLLARNEPPELPCTKCGKPATQILSSGWGPAEEDLFCDTCIDPDEEEGLLPVVNSPRAGVCGYSG
jgi:hypothetical protein